MKSMEQKGVPAASKKEQVPKKEKLVPAFGVPEKLEPAEATAIFEAAKLTGSTFDEDEDGNKKILTKEILSKEGLAPKHKIVIGNVSIYLSPVYEGHEGRVAVTAYVKKGEETVAQTFYRSDSQGVWRLLPFYEAMYGKMLKYGKGGENRGEESITLPIELQKALAEIGKGEKPVSVSDVDFIMAGPSWNQYERTATIKELPFWKEVDEEPELPIGGWEFAFHNANTKTEPEKIDLYKSQNPEFSKMLATWTDKTDKYGEVTYEVYPSIDGELKFLFCRDAYNRVWIGQIENNSEVTSVGVRKSFFKGGDLTCPAFEYGKQSGSYGNFEWTNGHYVDMYANYLSKIPVIKRYEEHRKQEEGRKTELLARATNILGEELERKKDLITRAADLLFEDESKEKR